MRYSRDFSYRANALLALVIAVGCGGSDSVAPTVPPALTVQAGVSQSVMVATPTPVSPSVTLTDSHGKHPAGITVTFTPDSGAGSVSIPIAKTDNSGVASAGVWTIGTVAAEQRLTASATVDGTVVNATLSVNALPGRPADIKIVSGDAQNGPYGATLIAPIQVAVTDQYGNATPGVSVRFSVDTGGVTAATDTTGADGTVSTRVRLPVTTGPVVLSVATDSIPVVKSTFTSRGVRFASFSIDGGRMCGLSVEGYPYCWGRQLPGLPLGVPAGQIILTPQPLAADLDLNSIALNDAGGCGLRTDGVALCWGFNLDGGVGRPRVNLNVEFDTLAAVVGNLSFKELQRGPATTCGTTTGGQSYCWGANEVGQIGSSSAYLTQAVPRPTLVDGGITFHSYALGAQHSCALDPSGKAYCWGMDIQGQLGVAAAPVPCTQLSIANYDSTFTQTTCARSPVVVDTPVRFTTLASTLVATCGLDASGTTFCWGSNDWLDLGTGDMAPADTVPTQLPGAPAFKQLVGHDEGFCGLTSGGDIYCWGYVSQVVGLPPQACTAFDDCTPNATKVSAGRQFTSIAFTFGQLCGLSDGILYCWGGAYSDSAGDEIVITPTRVAGQSP